MFVTTSAKEDPRVMKEATALVLAGYEVHVIGLLRQGIEPLHEVFKGVSIQRIDVWHVRFVRWLKALKGLNSAQGMFHNNSNKSQQSNLTRIRQWITNILHQLEDFIHLFAVCLAFFWAGFSNGWDIYHAHDVDTLLPAFLLSRLFRKVIVYDSHEYWYGQRERFISHKMYYMIERICLPYCSEILTVNTSIAERISTRYRVQFPTVLLNVPDQSVNQSPSPMSADGPVRLLFHGFFQRKRGLDILIDAMLYVRSPAHLTLRGYGDLELALKHRVKELRLEERICFEPKVPIEDVIRAATGYHVGFIPFEKESTFCISLPNKLFEYMAAGLAIITNNLYEIAKIVDIYNLGVIYDSDDPRILAKVIDQFVINRSQLEWFRNRAWEVYNERFTWQKNKGVLLDTYSNLCKV